MNGHKIFVDTNIILYLIDGNKKISQVLNGKEIYISFISELELLSYSDLDKVQESIIASLLSECKIIGFDEWIKTHTIEIRKKTKLKFPDSIIVATSKFLNIPFLTADKRLSKAGIGNVLLFEENSKS